MIRKQPRLSGVLLALLLPLGLLGADTPPNTPANRSDPVIVIVTRYPGASARTVAETVTVPIEEQLLGLENLRYTLSRCTNDGRYVLQLHLKPGADLNMAQVLAQNRVSIAAPVLPESVQRDGVLIRKQVPAPRLFLTLHSPDNSLDTVFLGRYASVNITPELLHLEGVADVTSVGESDLGLRAWLDPDRLAALDLTTADVVKAVREQNIQTEHAPAGQGVSIALNTQGRRTRPEDIANIIVKASREGEIVRLKDLARVEMGVGRPRGEAFLDQRPVVALGISPTSNTSLRAFQAAVRDRMELLKKDFPAGLDYTLLVDLTGAGAKDEKQDRCWLVEPVLPVDLSAERAREVLDRYTRVLLQTPGVQHVLALSKCPYTRFGDGPGLVVVLDRDFDPARWVRSLPSLRKHLDEVRTAIPRLRELAGADGFRSGYPLELALRGPEAAEVRLLADRLVERLARTRKLTDLPAIPESTRQLVVDIDRTRASTLGVSVRDVLSVLQVALGSAPVGEPSGDRRFERTHVPLTASERDLAADLRQLQVRGAEGKRIPLSTLVTLRETEAPAHIDRLDLRPALEIGANPAPGISLAEARWLCETLAEQTRKELGLSSAYRLVWLGPLPAAKPLKGALKEDEEPAPPDVVVSRPVVREITDYEDFTGRTQAVSTVELRPRVSGYIEKVLFKDGSAVKKGDVLFAIDPRPYQASLDQAKAQVDLSEASLELARAEYARARKLLASGGISREDVDAAKGKEVVAQASLAAARASLALARLNLDFCNIRAPIDGRIGRSLLDPGNLVKADDTHLATLHSQDPLYVYFDVDERTLLRLRRSADEGKLPVLIGTADDRGYPLRGTLDFANNQVNPNTGTIAMRAVLPNPKGDLVPGLFVRVRLPIGKPHKALLIPDEVIRTSLGQKTVYVVDDKDKVVSRRVTLGARLLNGLRVIDEGLKPDDRVIVRGQMRVRPGMTVKPQLEPLPERKPREP